MVVVACKGRTRRESPRALASRLRTRLPLRRRQGRDDSSFVYGTLLPHRSLLWNSGPHRLGVRGWLSVQVLFCESVSDASDSAEEYWQHAFQQRITFYDALVEQHRGATIPQDSLALVETELRAFQAQSAIFYKRVNALRPISRLSPELLSEIFHYLSLLEPAVPAEPEVLEDRETRRSLAPAKTWIKVTHVCSTFRQCALGDRSLWRATTTAFGPDWMRLLAERSQVPPLSVHIGTAAPVPPETRALLDRAQAVQVTRISDVDSFLKSRLALPEARSLRIHMTSKDQSKLWDATDGPELDIPHLADLHVYGLPTFDLDQPCITSSLTSLYIGSGSEDIIEFHIRSILDTLAKLPRLERLTFSGCELWADSEINPSSIPTPSLKHLHVDSAGLTSAAQLFDALDLPADVSVHLTGDAPYVTSDEVAWNYIEHALCKPAWADLSTLELLGLPENEPEMVRHAQAKDEGALVFSAWRLDEPGYVCISGQPTGDRCAQLRLGTTQNLRPKPDFHLHLNNYIGGRGANNTLKRAMTYFRAATDLRTLSVRPGILTDIKLDWLDILTKYPHLTAIRVDDEADFTRILEALHFVQEPLLARELTTISLPRYQGWRLYWSEHINMTNPANKKKRKRGERGALLASVLLQRAAAGAPLANIYLHPSQLQMPQMQDILDAITKGAKGQSELVQNARKVFQPAKMWDWEDWGRGL